MYDLFAEADQDTVAKALRELHFAAHAAYRYHHETICGDDTYRLTYTEYRAKRLATLGPDMPDEAVIVQAWIQEQKK